MSWSTRLGWPPGRQQDRPAGGDHPLQVMPQQMQQWRLPLGHALRDRAARSRQIGAAQAHRTQVDVASGQPIRGDRQAGHLAGAGEAPDPGD